MGSTPEVTASPATAADAAWLLALERAENFPVALRVLPRRHRDALRQAYSLARRIDDAGDDPAVGVDERLARLDALEDEVRGRYAGTRFEQPYLDLIEANRRDQTVRRYPTYADLLAYCRLSADPIGRIVLTVFNVDDDLTARLSDLVCTALQILEHCQDVGEDRRDRDRIYLPAEDLARFGVDETDLDASVTPRNVRQLLAFEADRADAMLTDGAAIVGRLHGWARVAVAGYVAGGRATVDAIRHADCDVLAGPPRPRAARLLRHALPLLLGRA